jgi:EAL domain-containing protein (putative c-di-GMP-specific phosphodiesterase class I)
MEEQARARHALEQDLRGALEAREFHLMLQPQVRLDTSIASLLAMTEAY